MKKLIQSRLYMNYALLLTFQVNMLIIKKMFALDQMVDELKENVTAMEEGMSALQADGRGITDGKNNTRLELAELTSAYSGILKSFATDKKNFELKKKIGVPSSRLKAMGAGKLLNYSRLVLEQLKAFIDELAPYEMTTVQLTSYTEAINRLADEIGAPQQAESAKKAVAARLKELVKKNRELINDRIRPVILKIKLTEPSFYVEFMESSKIRSPYTNHSRAEGLVTDKQTGLPLSGVQVRIPGTSYTAVTIRNGAYRLLVPEKGTYTLEFVKDGYTLFLQKEVQINTGEATIINAQMTASGT